MRWAKATRRALLAVPRGGIVEVDGHLWVADRDDEDGEHHLYRIARGHKLSSCSACEAGDCTQLVVRYTRSGGTLTVHAYQSEMN